MRGTIFLKQSRCERSITGTYDICKGWQLERSRALSHVPHGNGSLARTDMTSHNHEEQYAQALGEFRRQKDEFFRTSPDSPIPEEDLADFQGLHYFPPDLALRLVAQVERLPDGKAVQMATSDNSVRAFQRYALLHFEIDGQPCTLTAYRGIGDPPDAALFVPFRDALAGTETYGSGRYLEVEEEDGSDGSTIAVLDFNLAYNPYCAYNDAYSCPITPPENMLKTPIRAGERIYHD
jgi:uncharacterized protein (DUF1684 family)